LRSVCADTAAGAAQARHTTARRARIRSSDECLI
jgi:hypothetical protein